MERVEGRVSGWLKFRPNSNEVSVEEMYLNGRLKSLPNDKQWRVGGREVIEELNLFPKCKCLTVGG